MANGKTVDLEQNLNKFLPAYIADQLQKGNKKKQKRRRSSDRSSTTSSQLSTSSIEKIIDQLRLQKHRDSTKRNYYAIWKLFNKFILRLDQKPRNWEQRLLLFVGHLIDSKKTILHSEIICFSN